MSVSHSLWKNKSVEGILNLESNPIPVDGCDSLRLMVKFEEVELEVPVKILVTADSWALGVSEANPSQTLVQLLLRPDYRDDQPDEVKGPHSRTICSKGRLPDGPIQVRISSEQDFSALVTAELELFVAKPAPQRRT